MVMVFVSTYISIIWFNCSLRSRSVMFKINIYGYRQDIKFLVYTDADARLKLFFCWFKDSDQNVYFNLDTKLLLYLGKPTKP